MTDFPLDPAGDDISEWSRRSEAPGKLPEFVRRLLLATTPLDFIEMRADGGVRLRGLDGQVVAAEASAFCPAGRSFWELTVRDDEPKFDEDIAKRRSDPLAPEASYVAVSARRVPGKREWQEKQTALGPFRAVRLIDADDLSTWLGLAPAVSLWFNHLRSIPVSGLIDLTGYLATWRPLPATLLLAGNQRQRSAERVRAWASAPRASPLRVYADSTAEALAFVAAALESDEENGEVSEKQSGRTIVVQSQQALRWAIRSQPSSSLPGLPRPLLILPDFDGFSPDQADPQSRIVVPLVRADYAPGESHSGHRAHHPAAPAEPIDLWPIPMVALAKQLQQTGVADHEARRLAAASGGQATALQRLMGDGGPPLWASGHNVKQLGALWLVGAWTPGNPADQEVFARLGVTYPAAEQQAEQLAQGPEPPLVREQNNWGKPHWRWAQQGAWSWLAGRLGRELLQRFEAVVVDVLGWSDPGLDRTPEENLAVSLQLSLQGGVVRESSWLREGLARSLVRLAGSDAALVSLHGTGAGSALGTRVVRELLGNDWHDWASLSDVLPLLAEAAPGPFLDQLEASLELGEKGVTRLLAEEGPRGAPHTSLLWALETLGWSEEHLPRVALCLARLAQADFALARSGRLANRPAASLGRMLDSRFAQTRAPLAVRLGLLARILRDTPRVGESLVLGQIESIGLPGLRFTSRSPEVRPWALLTPEEMHDRAVQELPASLEQLTDLALVHAGTDAGRWARLLRVSWRLPGELAEKTLSTLEARQGQLAGNLEVWKALREHLRWLLQHDQGGGQRRLRSEQLYEQFAPIDAVERIAWLFEAAPAPPVSIEDWQQEQEYLKGLRKAALRDLWQRDDRYALLDRLACIASAPWVLGELLAEMEDAAQLEGCILRGTADSKLASLTIGFACALWPRRTEDWRDATLGRLVAGGRLRDAARLCYAISGGPPMWDLVSRFGDPLWTAYWRELHGVSRDLKPSDIKRAIDNFMAVGSTITAFETAAAAASKLATSTLLEVLEELATSPGQLGELSTQASAEFWLDQLFQALASRNDLDQPRATRLELQFFPWLGSLRRPSRFLGPLLAQSPADFVELLCWLYRREGETPPPPGPELEARQQRAEAAYRILDSWHGYPGSEQSPPSQAPILAWCRAVLAMAASSGREGVGKIEVTRVLARVPPGEDGIWPCRAARELVEQDATNELARHLAIAKFNLRGVTTRALGDGGLHERAISLGYQQGASRLAIEWPRTAAMLRSMAEDFERSADEHDAAALADLRQGGLDTDDLPAVARYLKPQDIVLALWLAVTPEPPATKHLAQALDQPEPEIDASRFRLRVARLLIDQPEGRKDAMMIARTRLVDLVIQEIRTAFPAQKGLLARGMPTGLAATPLRTRMLLGTEDLLVWPTDRGSSEGVSLQPLTLSVPGISQKNPHLHQIFALMDVLRTGHARERKLASARLRSLLLDIREPELRAS